MGSLFSSDKGKGSSNGSKGGNGKAASASNKNTNPQSQVTSKDRAILDLKNAKDRLKKFKKKLEVDSEKLTNEAKELIKQQKKDRALLVLKLRKYKENELNQLDAKLLSIMEMIEQVEWESANMEVLKALKAGNDVLNKFHQEMSVEDVEALLEETNEAIEVENQINQLLSGQLNQFDEAALQEELDQIMGTGPASNKQATIASPQQKSTSPNLPNAPTHLPAAQAAEELDTRQAALA